MDEIEWTWSPPPPVQQGAAHHGVCFYSALSVALLTTVVAPAQDCYGPGDIDRDFVVATSDFARIQSCLGGVDVSIPPVECGEDNFTDADFDSDGDVDLRDVARFTLLVGQPYFDYGPYREDKVAEWLAVELTGQLRAPDAEYERIHRDLQLIRGAYPELADVRAWLIYGLNRLLVRLELDLPRANFDPLNPFYQVVRDDQFTIVDGLHVLYSCDTLNAAGLAQDYELLPEVIYAEPDYFLGDGDHIFLATYADVNDYRFIHGYGDCLSGCYCATVWDVAVDEDGAVGPVSCFDTCTGECP